MGQIISQNFHYTPYVWPIVGSLTLQLTLMFLLWRQKAPSSTHLYRLGITIVFWSVGAFIELTANPFELKLIGVTLQGIMALPANIFTFLFIIDYTDQQSWITRSAQWVLAWPIVLVTAAIMSNPLHHLFWSQLLLSPSGVVILVRGPFFWLALGYGLVLSVIAWLALGHLFHRSPAHRGMILAIVAVQLANRLIFMVEAAGYHPFDPLDGVVLGGNFSVFVYALAIYRFHWFDLSPIGQETIIQQLGMGLCVLDEKQRVMDYNQEALALLGVDSLPITRPLAALPHLPPQFMTAVQQAPHQPQQIFLATGRPRWLELHSSPLLYAQGLRRGQLLLLSDITERKQLEQQAQEYQTLRAMLAERGRMERELHDTLTQQLAAVRLVAETALIQHTAGDLPTVSQQLARLADMADAGYHNLRAYIHGNQPAFDQEKGIIEAVTRYVATFAQLTSLSIQLEASPGWSNQQWSETVQFHLYRIVQEGLQNIYKHAQAKEVRVLFQQADSQQWSVVLEDDGVGLRASPAGSSHFGLRSMQERATLLGGTVRLENRTPPQTGTRLTLLLPPG